MKNKKSQYLKECGSQDCGCKDENNKVLQTEFDPLAKDVKPKEDISENKKSEKTLDPTHFGDWQIGCRTIDF